MVAPVTTPESSTNATESSGPRAAHIHAPGLPGRARCQHDVRDDLGGAAAAQYGARLVVGMAVTVDLDLAAIDGGSPMVSRQRAEDFVDRFAAGWSAPHPLAWDSVFAPDAVIEQPLLARGQGLLPGEFGRLFAFLPDPTGHLVRWGLSADAVLIELACTATLGRHRLRFTVVDRCTLGEDGRCTWRTTYMNPVPLALAVATHPTTWLRWRRSGVGPFIRRRRLLRPTGYERRARGRRRFSG